MKEPLQVIYYFLDDLRRLKDYLAFSERLQKEDHDAYLASLAGEDEEQATRFASRRDLAADLSERFPQHLRSSSLLILFALFEENLNHVCESLREHRALMLGFSDVSGKGIDRSRKYIGKVAGWKIPETNWQGLKNVQTIRNLFAHNAGFIGPHKLEEISKIVSDSPHLRIESFARDKVFLEKDYLEYSRSLIRSFVSDLAQLNQSV